MERFKTDHRHTLYREYLKILAAFRPTIFVMENVKGILSSRHEDEAIFGRILEDMRYPWGALSDADRTEIPQPDIMSGYRIFSFSIQARGDMQLRPVDYIIESEHYGLPQKRHRVILLGIRDDYNVSPPVLELAGGAVTVRDVIDGLPKLRSRISQGDVDGTTWVRSIRSGRRHMKAGAEAGEDDRCRAQQHGHSLGGGGRFVQGGEPPGHRPAGCGSNTKARIGRCNDNNP